MPFISGFSPEGRTAGEIAKQREIDEKKARRESWEKSEAYIAFNAADFVGKIDADLEQKKKEYDVIKAGLFGSLRGVLTRYQEKDAFLNDEIAPLLRKCRDSSSTENREALVAKLQAGIELFTTFEKQSGIAKILETALFALTDSDVAEKADFYFYEADQEKTPVVASVAHEIQHRSVVVGKVVAQTKDDDLRILSEVSVPKTPIRLFNRVQPAFAISETDTSDKVKVFV